jgi:hypothetical protein
MQRFASLVVIVLTAYFLVATSAPPCTATPAKVTVTARTSCGVDRTEEVAVDSSCLVTLSDSMSGLPTQGLAGGSSAELRQKTIHLNAPYNTDGGFTEICVLDPNDAGTGWDVTCNTCAMGAECTCTGTLVP